MVPLSEMCGTRDMNNQQIPTEKVIFVIWPASPLCNLYKLQNRRKSIWLKRGAFTMTYILVLIMVPQGGPVNLKLISQNIPCIYEIDPFEIIWNFFRSKQLFVHIILVSSGLEYTCTVKCVRSHWQWSKKISYSAIKFNIPKGTIQRRL